VRFNFDFDILYLDIGQEEEGLHHFFGVSKETKLTRLKYVAIDEAYLGVVDLHLTIAALKRTLNAMTDLEETIVVCDITIRRSSDSSIPSQVSWASKLVGALLERQALLPEAKEAGGGSLLCKHQ
jgi:hypothetical protein